MADRLNRQPFSGPVRLRGGYASDPPEGVRTWVMGVWTTPSDGYVPVVVLPATGDGLEEAITAASATGKLPPHQVREVLDALIAAAGKRGSRRG